MDLNLLVSGVTSAINARVPVMLQNSTGYTQGANFARTPAYGIPVNLLGQVQPLSTGDLRKLDAMNIQGVSRAIYLQGEVDAIQRVNQKGGDLVTVQAGPQSGVYLTKVVLEQWSTWAKVGVVLQDGS